MRNHFTEPPSFAERATAAVIRWLELSVWLAVLLLLWFGVYRFVGWAVS